jgi:hypothetical protein
MHPRVHRSSQEAPRHTQEAPRTTQEHPGGTQEHQGGTQEHPGGTQEAPRSTQEAPRSTQETPRRHPGDTQERPRGHPEAPRAPEVILSENQPKPLSFTVKMAAGTYFVREWRRRHAPFPQPAHRNESPQCANGAAHPARPLYQHRKNPYR